MTALALVALMGCVALSVDVGRGTVAAQKAQSSADAAALAGGALLRYPADGIAAAQATITANNDRAGAYAVTCNYVPDSSTSDLRYYPPWSWVPGYGMLGPAGKALRVRCRINLPYTFGRLVGLNQAAIVRESLVVRAPVGGCPIMPMWVSHPTPYNYGDYQDLLMADGPHVAGIPGNFGWLALPSGVSVSWEAVMRGDQLSEADTERMYTSIGGTVWGRTGLAVGQWVDALNTRITRGSSGVFAGETFASYSPNNPRIILVPLVSYIDGTGSNARFTVQKFGAFWLDNVNSGGNPKGIGGRFIRYTMPGAGMDPLSEDVGLFTYRLAG